MVIVPMPVKQPWKIRRKITSSKTHIKAGYLCFFYVLLIVSACSFPKTSTAPSTIRMIKKYFYKSDHLNDYTFHISQYNPDM